MVKNIEDLKVYQLALKFEEECWEIVQKWGYFEKDTIGKQLVRAADSISANICEGYGRYHYKENRNFLFYSRGSLYETKNWLKKANNRKLVSDKQFQTMMNQWEIIIKMLNAYIRSIGKKQSTP